MEFRDIPNLEHYQVNLNGDVRSVDRYVYYGVAERFYPGRLTSYRVSYDGDRKYFLRKNKQQVFRFASQLISAAFTRDEIEQAGQVKNA